MVTVDLDPDQRTEIMDFAETFRIFGRRVERIAKRSGVRDLRTPVTAAPPTTARRVELAQLRIRIGE